MSTFLREVDQRLRDSKLSRAEFARRVGIHRSTVTRYLNGAVVSPDPRVLLRFASELDLVISPDDVTAAGGAAGRINAASAAHLKFVRRWASEVALFGMSEPLALSDAYVDIALAPWVGTSSSTSRFRATDLLSGSENYLILGAPGAGKTTLVKRLAVMAMDRPDGVRVFPVVVRLRTLGEGDKLLLALARAVGFSGEPTAQSVARALDDLSAIVLLDGLDEVPPMQQLSLLRDIEQLIWSVDRARMVVTSRTAGARTTLPKTSVLEMQPLGAQLVRDLAEKWLGSSAPHFIRDLLSSPYGGSEVRPLALVTMCLLYRRRGSLPRNPRSVYRLLVSLLLEEWDVQRRIHRHTDYAGFDRDRKQEFLEAMSAGLFERGCRGRFSTDDLLAVYRDVSPDFGLPAEQAGGVVREIESHTGLIVQAGPEAFEFTHIAIQEYLAANFAVKSPSLPGVVLRDPAVAAVATSLSSDPSGFISSVWQGLLAMGPEAPVGFSNEYLARLAVERPNMSRESIDVGVLANLLAMSQDDDRAELSVEQLVDRLAGGTGAS